MSLFNSETPFWQIWTWLGTSDEDAMLFDMAEITDIKFSKLKIPFEDVLMDQYSYTITTDGGLEEYITELTMRISATETSAESLNNVIVPATGRMVESDYLFSSEPGRHTVYVNSSDANIIPLTAVTVNANYTIIAGSGVHSVTANTNIGNIDVRLPAAGDVPNEKFLVTNNNPLSGNTLTIIPDGSEVIDGLTSLVVPNYYYFYSDGVQWYTLTESMLIVLPPANQHAGERFLIIKTGADAINDISVVCSAGTSDTIDGSRIKVINHRERVLLFCTGSQYHVVSGSKLQRLALSLFSTGSKVIIFQPHTLNKMFEHAYYGEIIEESFSSNWQNGLINMNNIPSEFSFRVRVFYDGLIDYISEDNGFNYTSNGYNPDWLKSGYPIPSYKYEATITGGNQINFLSTESSTPLTIHNTNINYVITGNVHTVEADTTSGTVTATLPTASAHTGELYSFIRVAGSGNFVISPSGGATIDGDSSKTITDNNRVYLRSDGTNWGTSQQRLHTHGVGWRWRPKRLT